MEFEKSIWITKKDPVNLPNLLQACGIRLELSDLDILEESNQSKIVFGGYSAFRRIATRCIVTFVGSTRLAYPAVNLVELNSEALLFRRRIARLD